jgi:HD-like signal output (HDOD) protein
LAALTIISKKIKTLDKMGIVPINKLIPGMLLAEQVKDVNGRLILAKDKKIHSSHIRKFKIWGITEVNISGGVPLKDKPRSQNNSEIIEKTNEKVKYIFSHIDLEHPVAKEIFRLSVEYRTKNNTIVEEKKLIPNQKKTIENNRNVDFLKRLHENEIKLPEIPSVISELNEVIFAPYSSAQDIANVVNNSPSLAATLLKIVNSALYSCPARIDNLSQAVTLIGTKEIYGLALYITVISIFNKIPQEIINMHFFLKHSMACSIIARSLAAHKNLPQTEQLFVSGLLHDLGRVLLYIYFPDDSLNILIHSRKSNKLLYEVENEYLGCNHTHFAKHLMQLWKLPPILENNVFYHHNPSAAPYPIPATIVHLADILANGLGMGGSGERFVPPLDYKAWEDVGLSINTLEVTVKQSIHQFNSLETTILN